MKAIIIGHDSTKGIRDLVAQSNAIQKHVYGNDISVVTTTSMDKIIKTIPDNTELIHVDIESNGIEEIEKHLIQPCERGIVIIGSNIDPTPVTRMKDIESNIKLNPVIFHDFKSGKENRRERRKNQRKR